METIELKGLPLKESDFTFVNEYTKRVCGYAYTVVRYEVAPKLIGETENVSARDIYKNYYATVFRSGRTFVETTKDEGSLADVIENLNRRYKAWQLGKHFGGQHTEAEAHEIFDVYRNYFDNPEFPTYREAWNATKQEQVADELGLGKRLMTSIWCQDDNLYVDMPELVYSTADGIDVYIDVKDDKARLMFLPRYDTYIAGRSLNNNGHNWNDFDNAFDVKEPQRFSLGKCTPKKRDAWFAYIKAYYNAAKKFFAERNDAVDKAVKKLQSAGFERIGDSMSWRCSKGYFDCKAEVGNDGKIYTDISISYKSNVKEEVFGI